MGSDGGFSGAPIIRSVRPGLRVAGVVRRRGGREIMVEFYPRRAGVGNLIAQNQGAYLRDSGRQGRSTKYLKCRRGFLTPRDWAKPATMLDERLCQMVPASSPKVASIASEQAHYDI
jgi:hypothetical protein